MDRKVLDSCSHMDPPSRFQKNMQVCGSGLIVDICSKVYGRVRANGDGLARGGERHRAARLEDVGGFPLGADAARWMCTRKIFVRLESTITITLAFQSSRMFLYHL